MYEIFIQPPGSESVKHKLPVWLQPDFLKAVGELHQAQTYHLICRKGEQTVALMPLFEKKQLGIKRLFCPMSAYYQGLWFFWEAGREVNRNMLDELKVSSEVTKLLKAQYQKMQFNLAPHNLDIRGFTWAGLSAVPYYTFIQDLSEPLILLKDERKKIRLAQSKGYVLEERFEPATFIQMFKDLYQRKQKDLRLPYARFAQWMSTLHQAGLLTQFNLLLGKEIVSSNLVLGGQDDSTCYSILRSTRPEDLANGASALHSLLLVELLKDRFQRIDFCGGNTPEVARFKAALGFQLGLFFKITK